MKLKHWLSGLLAALLLLTLTGCGLFLAAPTDVDGTDGNPVLFAGAEDKVDLPVEDPEDAAAPEGTPDEDADTLETLPPDDGNAPADNYAGEEDTIPENGSYTTKEDVAEYIRTYGHLPENFITKEEARDLGWPGGSLEPYAPGKCIGGDQFYNSPSSKGGKRPLPDAPGRIWTECDIDTLRADSRGAKRIVFSNDGLIYYTWDHYNSFILM